MSDPNTVRILSIDGGGMRGIVSAYFLKLFVQEWGINSNEIWKYFDVIAGSSVGAIAALGYAFGKSPDDMITLLRSEGPYIFTTSSSLPSVQPSTLSKINTIVGGPLSSPTFYPSNTSGIGQMRLKSALDTTFGAQTLINAKTNVLVTAFEKNDDQTDFTQDTNTPVYFSNSALVPILSGQNNKVSDVSMASSAAPLYFAPWVIGNNSYIDGGVTQNNPASFALALGRSIKKGANRFCALSLGTGLGDVGFPSAAQKIMTRVKNEIAALKQNEEAFAQSWQLTGKKLEEVKTAADNFSSLAVLDGAYLIMFLLGATIAGPQEVAAQELHIRSNYTLEQLHSFRAQYYLEPSLDTELDNSSSSILDYYQTSATTYYNNNRQEISNFLAKLVK